MKLISKQIDTEFSKSQTPRKERILISDDEGGNQQTDGRQATTSS